MVLSDKTKKKKNTREVAHEEYTRGIKRTTRVNAGKHKKITRAGCKKNDYNTGNNYDATRQWSNSKKSYIFTHIIFVI
ncbi:hypothetical protein P8452_25999 [Trifolium repens]|nr:hypothetical protein P8452_25999 [Trifolium repens]